MVKMLINVCDSDNELVSLVCCNIGHTPMRSSMAINGFVPS